MKPSTRILLIEDEGTDVMLLKELFAGAAESNFEIEHVERLADAVHLLDKESFDAVLLDLGLPDSQGVETFVRLHRHAPDVPVLVLTALEDEAIGAKTVGGGAQDFLVKKQVQAPLLRNSVRYAILRAEAQREQEETRQREQQERELIGMDLLSASPGTSVTAQIYSGQRLKESSPDEFQAIVEEYSDVLKKALEQRIFRSEDDCSQDLRELAQRLGFLRSSPRDIVEIHTTALRKLLEDVPSQKAQAYLEEGRLSALELMGYLAGYYRSFYPASIKAKATTS